MTLTPETRNLLRAGDAMEARLKLFKKTALQAHDRGETFIELPIEVVWEPSDDVAVLFWESSKAAVLDQKPLFCEEQL